jgi:ketosteroid isomerase-like protein
VPPKLPESIAAYFTAVNRRDVPAFLGVLARDPVVKDEGREHRGAVKIRIWLEDAIRKYDVTVEPLHLATSHGDSVVTAKLSGNFPGSPLELQHRFTLADGKVARLEIG